MGGKAAPAKPVAGGPAFGKSMAQMEEEKRRESLWNTGPSAANTPQAQKSTSSAGGGFDDFLL